MGGEQVYCASLVLYIIIIIIITVIPSFSVLLNCLYLGPRILLFFSPLSCWKGSGEQCVSGCMAKLASCQVKPRHQEDELWDWEQWVFMVRSWSKSVVVIVPVSAPQKTLCLPAAWWKETIDNVVSALFPVTTFRLKKTHKLLDVYWFWSVNGPLTLCTLCCTDNNIWVTHSVAVK